MASFTNKANKKRSLSEGDISNPPAKRVSFNPIVKKKSTNLKVDKSSRIIVIIDETGSMTSRKEATISATKEFIESQINVKIEGEEEPSLTFVFFNVTSRTFTWDKLSKVKDSNVTDNLDSVLSSYNPDNCTALYDTLHNVFTEFEHEENNIVAIFTDGQDNSSRKANVKEEVKTKIDNLKTNKQWQFHFLTVGLDTWSANHIGQSMGLNTQVINDTDDVSTQMGNLMRSVSQNITSSRRGNSDRLGTNPQ
jgi:hypothetical protein